MLKANQTRSTAVGSSVRCVSIFISEIVQTVKEAAIKKAA
jgi:hypothetical protein